MWSAEGPGGEALPQPLRGRVERLVIDQATRSERALSIGREAFCLLVLLRFLVLGGGSRPDAAVTIPAVAVAMGFSAYLLLRRRPFPRWLFGVSGLVDATVCFAALLPNVLWPAAVVYHGLLMSPDVTAIFIMVSVSGLRLSPRLAVLSTLYNTVSGALLVTLDALLNGVRSEVDGSHIALAGIWLFSASWIAVTLARRGRDLATQGAVESLRGAFAMQNLRALLAGHHDARTLLSSVSIHADLLARRLALLEHDAEVERLSAELHRDLSELRELERSIKEHAWGAVVSQGAPAAADPQAAFEAAARSVSTLFPHVRTSLEGAPRLRVLVAGGGDALERAISNLLVNACEGDGRRGASTVRVRVAAAGDGVRLSVEDDGPGFSAARLAELPDRPMTTKETGSGLGLVLVRSFAEASGGRVTLRNADGGGACVDLELPAAPTEERTAEPPGTAVV